MALFAPGRRSAALALPLGLLFAVDAAAQAPPPRVDVPPPPRAIEEPPRTVRWHNEWPRVRAWEYAATAVVLGTAFVLRFAGPKPPSNWQGGILFDDAFIDRIGLDNADHHRTVKYAGDALFYGSMAYRLVDSVFVPWAGYGDGDLALQMSMIDLEAFGTVAIVLWGSQLAVGRERPVVSRRCADPAFTEFTSECEPEDDQRNRSFIGGHAATVMAAAGVTCMHHGHNALYGGAADPIACGLMIGAAGATGVGRMMTEDHYPSDTILGWGLGAFAGWFVPAALHYGFDDDRPKRVSRRLDPGNPRLRVLLLPWANDQGGGLAALGLF
jgi:membrane-associated phospholipid phosphatase